MASAKLSPRYRSAQGWAKRSGADSGEPLLAASAVTAFAIAIGTGSGSDVFHAIPGDEPLVTASVAASTTVEVSWSISTAGLGGDRVGVRP